MALKADANNPLDYLNQMLKDNGIEVILPDDDDKEETKENIEEEKEDNE